MAFRMFTLVSAALLALVTGCAAESGDAGSKDEDITKKPPTPPSGEEVTGGPRNGSCSDAAGSLVYTQSHYQGGIPPRPETVVSTKKLVMDGEVVGETVRREDGQTSGTPWQVSLRFVDGTKQSLETTGNPTAGSETYAQKVEGTFLRHLGPTMESKQFSRFVICTNGWAMMP